MSPCGVVPFFVKETLEGGGAPTAHCKGGAGGAGGLEITWPVLDTLACGEAWTVGPAERGVCSVLTRPTVTLTCSQMFRHPPVEV